MEGDGSILSCFKKYRIFWGIMKEFLLRIDENTNRLLDVYMRKNNIKSKNKIINNILDFYLKNTDSFCSNNDIDRKLERLLKLSSLNNNLIEQLFANHEFPINNDRKEDEMLKEFHNDLRKNVYFFMD